MPAERSYCSELTSVVETITAANIVGVMTVSRELRGANYAKQFLRLKNKDLEAAGPVVVPA